MEVRALMSDLGKLVTSIGSQAFASKMYDLLIRAMSFDRMHISEWAVDQASCAVVSINDLGSHGICDGTKDFID